MTGLAAGCETPAEHAEAATVHALLNCYLREVDDGAVRPPAETPDGVEAAEPCVRLALPEQGVELFAPRRYRSPTGRHTFALPVYARQADSVAPIDAAALAALLRRELVRSNDVPVTAGTDLLRRVLLSRRETERIVREREAPAPPDADRPSFLAAERALVFGHLLHPTPKSREGFASYEAAAYAPELEGGFQLRYVAADPAWATEWAARDERATDWVEAGLRTADAPLPERVRAALADGRVLLPLHPWQAASLRERGYVQAALADDRLTDLGTFGPTFHPTSSVRTLYSPDAPYMVKGSLAVEITNAERTTRRSKIELAVAVAELLETGYGDALAAEHPDFSVLADAAGVTADVGPGVESGFETVLRENPFRGAGARDVATVVALCQDGLEGPSWLARIVSRLADRRGEPAADVAVEWFRRYLAVTVRPALWSYFVLGVGFEAHQQNTVLRLDEDGWPVTGYYRDNGGYCFPESRVHLVEDWLPDLRERVETVSADAVTDRCLRYYCVLNNAFGVCNALGVAGLADESDLLGALRSELRRLAAYEPPESDLVTVLLEDASVPCKANLCTRFEGRDELTSALESESVYVDVANPLVTTATAIPS